MILHQSYFFLFLTLRSSQSKFTVSNTRVPTSVLPCFADQHALLSTLSPYNMREGKNVEFRVKLT